MKQCIVGDGDQSRLQWVQCLRRSETVGNDLDVRSNHNLAKRMILNKNLLVEDCPVEGVFQLPKVLAYAGDLPDVFVPYDARVDRQSARQGVYCHVDDVRFRPTWTHPYRGLARVSRYMVAVAPDNTLWVDGRLCENLEQVRRNRTITRFWQDNGVPTVQSASWADAMSVDTFAFDGLAEDSWTAIGHQRVGGVAEQRLFRYAVSRLVERKRPLGLIVFGAKLDFDPGVPVKTYPSHISKLRKL